MGAKNMMEGSLPRNFLGYAVPLIFASLLSQAYGAVDAMIAGRFISDSALGAIGATTSFFTMVNTAFSGFAVGFAVYNARLFGQGEFARIKRDTVTIFVFLGVMGALMGILCFALRAPLFTALRVDPLLWKEAEIYFAVIVLGYPLLSLNFAFVQILYGLGVTGFSLIATALSAVLNVGGNLVAVLGLGMGVEGLALASLLSTCAVLVLYAVKLRRVFRSMPTAGERFSLHPACILASLRYSLPTCLQQMTMYLSGLLVAPQINALGAAATTGYSVAMRFYDLTAQSYQNSSKPLAVYTAQCIGAGREHQIFRGLLWGLCQGVLLMSPFVLICAIFADPLSALFFRQGFEGESMALAVRFARFFLPFLFINMVNNLFHAFLRGMGAMKLLLLSTAVGSVAQIVATKLLAPAFGMEGVYLGLLFAWGTEAVFVLFLFLLRYRTPSLIAKRARESK